MKRRQKRKVSLRPYATQYYLSLHDTKPAAHHHGACASEEGAIRATVVRVFLGQWAKAEILERDTGRLLYTVILSSAGISVHYGRAVKPSLLRRVK